jgi:hypothetical protein
MLNTLVESRLHAAHALNHASLSCVCVCWSEAGVSGSKGLRVRKSAARLVYLRDNGWDDLSDGADGTILSLLVSLAPFPSHPAPPVPPSLFLLVRLPPPLDGVPLPHVYACVYASACVSSRETVASASCVGTMGMKTSMLSDLVAFTTCKLPESRMSARCSFKTLVYLKQRFKPCALVLAALQTLCSRPLTSF